jgi:Bacterial membrane protein YfhO
VDVGTSDPTLGYQRADIVEFLRANLGLARMDSRTDVEGVWRPDTGLLYGFQDIYGDNPLVLNDWNAYWENLGGRDSPSYALLNVKYVLTRRGAPMPANFEKAYEGSGDITVWENKAAAPRAWLVTNAPPAGESVEDVTPSGEQNLQIVAYNPNEIVVNANPSHDGYLVLSEVYAPGWRATVDGKNEPVLRADRLFRAIPLQAGSHQVHIAYEPMSFQLGAIISGMTLLIVLGLLGWVFVTRHQ